MNPVIRNKSRLPPASSAGSSIAPSPRAYTAPGLLGQSSSGFGMDQMDRSSSTGSLSMLKLAQVQDHASGTEPVTRDELAVALKRESERWSERCMGEISNFECTAAEQRRTHEAALEKVVAEGVETMRNDNDLLRKVVDEHSLRQNSQIAEMRKDLLAQKAQFNQKLIELSDLVQNRDPALDRSIQNRDPALDRSMHSRDSSALCEDANVKSLRSDIEVCRAELKTTIPFVRNICDQNRQSVEHAESLISDLRQDLNMNREEHTAGIDGLKVSLKDMRRDFSDFQRELTQSMRDLERRSSADVSQSIQDLGDLVEASKISLKTDLQAEFLGKAAENAKTEELTRIADLQQVRHSLDDRIQQLQDSLDDKIHWMTKEHLSNHGSNQNDASDAHLLRTVEDQDAKHLSQMTELQEQFRQVEQSLQHHTKQQDDFDQRFAFVEDFARRMSSSPEHKNASPTENALSEDVASIMARLDILEHQASSSPVKVGIDDVATLAARMDLMEHSRGSVQPPTESSVEVSEIRDSVKQLQIDLSTLQIDLSTVQIGMKNSAAEAPLAEQVATKAAECIQRERAHFQEDLASKASHSAVIQTISQGIAAERVELEQIIGDRMKVLGDELRGQLSSDVARRLATCEARTTAVEASINLEFKRISSDLDMRVSQVEGNLLQSAQLGVRFRALDMEVKRTSSLLSSLCASKKSGDVLSESTTATQPRSPSPRDLDGIGRIKASSGAQVNSFTSASDKESPSCGDSNAGSSADGGMRDIEQLMNAIRNVRDAQQVEESMQSKQAESTRLLLGRLQSLLSEESSRIAGEMQHEVLKESQKSSVLSDGLKNTLGRLVDTVGKLGTKRAEGDSLSPRDGLKDPKLLLEVLSSDSGKLGAGLSGDHLRTDMEVLLQQLNLHLTGMGADVPSSSPDVHGMVRSVSPMADRTRSPELQRGNSLLQARTGFRPAVQDPDPARFGRQKARSDVLRNQSVSVQGRGGMPARGISLAASPDTRGQTSVSRHSSLSIPINLGEAEASHQQFVPAAEVKNEELLKSRSANSINEGAQARLSAMGSASTSQARPSRSPVAACSPTRGFHAPRPAVPSMSGSQSPPHHLLRRDVTR